MIKNYFKLTKMGITFFALMSAAAGFVLAVLTSPVDFNALSLVWLLSGLYFVISGSFILNQVYEWPLDALMKRTQSRPIPSGRLTALQAFSLGVVHLVLGFFVLLSFHPLPAGLALLTVVLYNVCYTIYWKKRWIFAAVPGAFPGAMPVVMGYSAVEQNVFSLPCLYLFCVLFLWQMPHFWSLALHYRKEYLKAGIPVLPAHSGREGTLYHISLYLLAYLGLAIISPLFFEMSIGYMFLLLPLCVKIFMEFLKFSRSLNFKPFFMWLNLSVLMFLWVPSLDIWFYDFLTT